MPKPDGSLSAVVVSGGKQYRVAPGDRILVDRIEAEPGSSLKLDRVLLLNDGSEIKLGTPALDGVDVEVKVLAHPRGPRLESLRYKSKKRVRVHHGGRADLTALQIIAVGGLTGNEAAEAEAAKPRSRGRAKAKTAEAAAPADSPKASAKAAAPAKPARRASGRKKESE